LTGPDAGLAEKSFGEWCEERGLSNQTFMLGITTAKQIIGTRTFAHPTLRVRSKTKGSTLSFRGSSLFIIEFLTRISSSADAT
jgi:hypothetical protein